MRLGQFATRACAGRSLLFMYSIRWSCQ